MFFNLCFHKSAWKLLAVSVKKPDFIHNMSQFLFVLFLSFLLWINWTLFEVLMSCRWSGCVMVSWLNVMLSEVGSSTDECVIKPGYFVMTLVMLLLFLNKRSFSITPAVCLFLFQTPSELSRKRWPSPSGRTWVCYSNLISNSCLTAARWPSHGVSCGSISLLLTSPRCEIQPQLSIHPVHRYLVASSTPRQIPELLSQSDRRFSDCCCAQTFRYEQMLEVTGWGCCWWVSLTTSSGGTFQIQNFYCHCPAAQLNEKL